ncbi:MAG: 4Fe-4S dicluster domain-containing protein [Coriobacteriales bacterium]|jgi:formate dehydrogenase subunit beta|nr:4Fe-4S dicluster domain-containing protein [Coriobacteriales bacterium]
MSDDLRARAIELLSSGQVAAVVGWAAGRFAAARHVYVATTPEQAENLVFDESCAPLAAKYVLEHHHRGKVALYTRGCESRAINRFIADHQLKREDVVLLGIPCLGMRDVQGAELKKCTECQRRNPVVSDELFGESVPELKPDRFAEVDRMMRLSREERRSYYDHFFNACVRCYACRQACPCCTCRECFVEQERPGWQGKEYTLNEARYYGLIRAFHTGDRCIECGECERVCPEHLPLMTLMHLQVRDIDQLFGPYEGGGLTDAGPDPLRSFKTDDVEEFM